MSTYLSVYLSEQAAAPIWGEKALLSYTDSSITLHLTTLQCLGAIQKAARKIASQGICHVDITGENWDLEKAWHFWLGFTSPKAKSHFMWSGLSQTDQEQLAKRMELVSWVRETINLPAQDLGPTALAERVVDLFNNIKSDHIHYSIIKGETLKEQGYHGLYSVGKGSSRPPVLLSVDFNPTGDINAPVFACLVGKGITFDSGGYSLKPSNFMSSMKADMGGAALVAASLAMAIHHGLTKRVKLFLCCADNLVSGQAFKLGDIIRYRNGKSVEVNNTDAEGRLVLADGLIDAEKEHPTYIIDAATLTGAAKTALGTEYHAALSFDDELVQTLLECAGEEHEHFWRLPLARFHRSQLPSAFADLSNCAAPQYSAGASTAAAFLSHFVENYQQGWLHIDCSATYQKSPTDCWATGATGIGVRTLARLLKQLSDH